MIFYNQVYQYTHKEEKSRMRIIELESSIVYFVDLHGDTSMPKNTLIEDLENEIEADLLLPISDPFLKSYSDKDLTDKQIQKREEDWRVASIGWENYKEQLLDKKTREATLQQLAEQFEIPKIKVKRIFSRFWQRGLNKNALLPDYMYSGGKGKEKRLSEQSNIGRKKKYNSFKQRISITDSVKKQILYVIKTFYRKKNQPTIQDTYDYLLNEYYSDSYYEGNVLKYRVWDDSRIPSYDQFYYWFKKLEDPKLDIQLRQSDKEFNLNHRPLLSNTALETDGPGTRFQVDATIADIYLVSSFDRNLIIGRPVVYGIVDVYSRLMTGVYVGLEGPSWVGAMMALDNMITDKQGFCARYGIDIGEEQWPAHHLPGIIIADRGEFEGYSVENLINNSNLKIENTSPYRGDLKGIIERQFRTMNGRIKRLSPGAIQKEFRERGDRDYRLDATLNLNEFTQVIIHLMLEHNNKIVDKYPLEKKMIVDQLVARPLNLWNWGIENKKGRLQIVDNRNIFRLNLLPKAKARITRSGIRFKGLSYGSEKAINEQWYLKKRGESLEIVYDPRQVNQIYIPYVNGSNYDTCYLLETSIQYKGDYLEEVEFYKELQQEAKAQEKRKQIDNRINTNSAIRSIIKQAAKEKKDSEVIHISKSEYLKDIRANRQAEKLMNREQENFDLTSVADQKKANVIDTNVQENLQEETPKKPSSRLMEKLKRKRDEEYEK
ncbi:Mu transposase C-terminal domain-containing protein [Lysinibacillus fusiformis]|uniref:Mu transposase C-terminal domain-containing protein n=1 Tax=Lysinibacillus fusiformis TaxID=28031 RepID=UPI00215B0DAC|nr:Mu transposase C-terminal domain-containing protein [Lysinibacillus fusiformis]MCR8855665.1 Mu transposase C-terminal domain-containing protein [Lysinibacillus fusiformis]